MMAIPEEIPEDWTPPHYTSERLFGQGYFDERKDAAYPWVDYVAIIFFNHGQLEIIVLKLIVYFRS